jgi:gliding motility-associated-like protein
MPNAFSPNEDGVNEILRLVDLTSEDIVEFKVFNRFGQLVYHNTDIDAGGSDGKYLGIPQPAEVYVLYCVISY